MQLVISWKIGVSSPLITGFLRPTLRSIQLSYYPANVRLELKRIKVKLRQPSQQPCVTNAHCHCIKICIGGSGWAVSGKCAVASMRIFPDNAGMLLACANLDQLMAKWAGMRDSYFVCHTGTGTRVLAFVISYLALARKNNERGSARMPKLSYERCLAPREPNRFTAVPRNLGRKKVFF